MFEKLIEKLRFPNRAPSEESRFLEALCAGTNYDPLVLGRNVNGRHERAMFLHCKDEDGNSEPKFEVRVTKSLFRTKYELFEKNIDERGVFSSKLFASHYDLASLKNALDKTPVDEDLINNKFKPSEAGNVVTNLWAGLKVSLRNITNAQNS